METITQRAQAQELHGAAAISALGSAVANVAKRIDRDRQTFTLAELKAIIPATLTVTAIKDASASNYDCDFGMDQPGFAADIQNALLGALENAVDDRPEIVDYASLTSAAGRCLNHIERMVWADVFAAYDAMHDAMRLPMQWVGGLHIGQPKLAGAVSYVLRALNTDQFIVALAESDRQFRRARLSCLREDEQQVEILAKMIALHTTDQTTQGQEDQSARVAAFHRLRREIADERRVLGITLPQFYIDIEGAKSAVTFDASDNGRALIDVSALCPECSDATAWAFHAEGYMDCRKFAVCAGCDKQWAIKEGR